MIKLIIWKKRRPQTERKLGKLETLETARRLENIGYFNNPHEIDAGMKRNTIERAAYLVRQARKNRLAALSTIEFRGIDEIPKNKKEKSHEKRI